MTIKEGRNILDPFIKKAEESQEPFIITHFSRDDNEFKGYHDGLDKFDVMIVISELVRCFDLTELDLQVAFNQAKKQ